MAKKKIPASIWIGCSILLLFALVAIFAPQLMPYKMTELFSPYRRPSTQHLLGTNDIGQDLLSELILGTRVTLTTGVVSALFIVLIGTAVGVAAGYLGGAVDRV